jgi:hypothetical protein
MNAADECHALAAVLMYCAVIWTITLMLLCCRRDPFSIPGLNGVPGNLRDARTGLQQPQEQREHVAIQPPGALGRPSRV